MIPRFIQTVARRMSDSAPYPATHSLTLRTAA